MVTSMMRGRTGDDHVKLNEFPELFEMEMEEYDELGESYSVTNNKMNQLLKNLVLTKLSNKRNELNILYLFQMINKKEVKSDIFEKIFSEIDRISEDINTNKYKFDDLILKNNEVGKRINPLMLELMK